MFVGMLAIGNGEKCPFCKTIMTKDIKIFDHIYKNHKEKLVENLFNKDEDMLFNLREIKEAVDWATGDDGFRSNEVIEILKQIKRENNNESKREKSN